MQPKYLQWESIPTPNIGFDTSAIAGSQVPGNTLSKTLGDAGNIISNFMKARSEATLTGIHNADDYLAAAQSGQLDNLAAWNPEAYKQAQMTAMAGEQMAELVKNRQINHAKAVALQHPLRTNVDADRFLGSEEMRRYMSQVSPEVAAAVKETIHKNVAENQARHLNKLALNSAELYKPGMDVGAFNSALDKAGYNDQRKAHPDWFNKIYKNLADTTTDASKAAVDKFSQLSYEGMLNHVSKLNTEDAIKLLQQSAIQNPHKAAEIYQITNNILNGALTALGVSVADIGNQDIQEAVQALNGLSKQFGPGIVNSFMKTNHGNLNNLVHANRILQDKDYQTYKDDLAKAWLAYDANPSPSNQQWLNEAQQRLLPFAISLDKLGLDGKAVLTPTSKERITLFNSLVSTANSDPSAIKTSARQSLEEITTKQQKNEANNPGGNKTTNLFYNTNLVNL